MTSLRAVPTDAPPPAARMTELGRDIEQLELARERTELLRQLAAVAGTGLLLALAAAGAVIVRAAVTWTRR